jgi:hypothetical protein
MLHPKFSSQGPEFDSLTVTPITCWLLDKRHQLYNLYRPQIQCTFLLLLQWPEKRDHLSLNLTRHDKKNKLIL